MKQIARGVTMDAWGFLRPGQYLIHEYRVVRETTMKLSAAQMQAIENGEAVPITVGHTKCVLLREDLYERVKALLDVEATYPLLDETFREGWEAPGMADYDRYDELKPR
jgi:hypothetical protein